jgi:phosphatidylserine decarboxylase
MKKLTLLQIVLCAFAYAAGLIFRMELWQIAVFFWAPIFIAGHIWFYWFRHVFFYRDPDRTAPDGENLILSAADGRVVYIYKVKGGEVVSDKKGQKINVNEIAKTEFEERDGWLVGVYMSPFDVHFNRAPVSGKISTLHYYQTGTNLPMVDMLEYISFVFLKKAVNTFAKRFHLENERMTMKIEGKDMTLFMILIADKFVNKITTYFSENQDLCAGEKVSFIQRGSQTDLFIPHENIDFHVKYGQQVYAGTTIIGKYR